MIYTVTFNPSLDYIVSVDDFRLGLTNRTDSELILPGGKGINVSTILNNLGIPSTALGFVAGFTGDEIAKKSERTWYLGRLYYNLRRNFPDQCEIKKYRRHRDQWNGAKDKPGESRGTDG